MQPTFVTDIAEFLSVTDITSLCSVSKQHRSAYSQCLKNKLATDLKSGCFTFNDTNPADEYIRIMTLNRHNFVMLGSERYVGLDEALSRAMMLGNNRMCRYFMNMSPNPESRYRHKLLMCFTAVAYGRRCPGSKILTSLIRNIRSIFGTFRYLLGMTSYVELCTIDTLAGFLLDHHFRHAIIKLVEVVDEEHLEDIAYAATIRGNLEIVQLVIRRITLSLDNELHDALSDNSPDLLEDIFTDQVEKMKKMLQLAEHNQDVRNFLHEYFTEDMYNDMPQVQSQLDIIKPGLRLESN